MEKHVQIYSSCDGWEITVIEIGSNKVLGRWTWGHEDFEMGVGGEKLFADVLRGLGCSVYEEEVY